MKAALQQMRGRFTMSGVVDKLASGVVQSFEKVDKIMHQNPYYYQSRKTLFFSQRFMQAYYMLKSNIALVQYNHYWNWKCSTEPTLSAMVDL